MRLDEQILILGDFNARIGDVTKLNSTESNISYSPNPDPITNQNGKDLITMCNALQIIPVKSQNLLSYLFCYIV